MRLPWERGIHAHFPLDTHYTSTWHTYFTLQETRAGRDMCGREIMWETDEAFPAEPQEQTSWFWGCSLSLHITQTAEQWAQWAIRSSRGSTGNTACIMGKSEEGEGRGVRRGCCILWSVSWSQQEKNHNCLYLLVENTASFVSSPLINTITQQSHAWRWCLQLCRQRRRPPPSPLPPFQPEVASGGRCFVM